MHLKIRIHYVIRKRPYRLNRCEFFSNSQSVMVSTAITDTPESICKSRNIISTINQNYIYAFHISFLKIMIKKFMICCFFPFPSAFFCIKHICRNVKLLAKNCYLELAHHIRQNKLFNKVPWEATFWHWTKMLHFQHFSIAYDIKVSEKLYVHQKIRLLVYHWARKFNFKGNIFYRN